jgi:hypothetical protein
MARPAPEELEAGPTNVDHMPGSSAPAEAPKVTTFHKMKTMLTRMAKRLKSGPCGHEIEGRV